MAEAGSMEPIELRERLRVLEETQIALINILEDLNIERSRAGETQQALLNILEDIDAERMKTEQARSLLESVNRELEAFSYSVSHDLRAPLRAISGFSQAVIEDCAPQLDENGKRYLDLIQENAHRMGQLIDDLLTFSRLGRRQMVEEDINLEEMAITVFHELSSLEPERHIHFSVKEMPSAKGDSSMIRQVLANLISNSIKFTRTREEAIIEVGYTSNQKGEAYYVKDNGVGFEMKYVDKLFGVFQRLHSTTEFEGSGVGLALAQRIITRHGGRIWAEGAVGQGATFFFTLPRGDRDGK